MCIGNTVAWLMAVYMEDGQYNLLWNVMIGSLAAALCGLAMAWLVPAYRVAGLLLAGPLCAIGAILAWHSARRRFAASR